MTSHTAFPAADRMPSLRLPPPGGPEDVKPARPGGEVCPVTARAGR